MKLYFEDEKGNKHEIEKVVGIQQGDVVLFAKVCFREETIRTIENYLSERFCRKVIILDGRFRDIVIVPPVQQVVGGLSKTDSPH